MLTSTADVTGWWTDFLHVVIQGPGSFHFAVLPLPRAAEYFVSREGRQHIYFLITLSRKYHVIGEN